MIDFRDRDSRSPGYRPDPPYRRRRFGGAQYEYDDDFEEEEPRRGGPFDFLETTPEGRRFGQLAQGPLEFLDLASNFGAAALGLPGLLLSGRLGAIGEDVSREVGASDIPGVLKPFAAGLLGVQAAGYETRQRVGKYAEEEERAGRAPQLPGLRMVGGKAYLTGPDEDSPRVHPARAFEGAIPLAPGAAAGARVVAGAKSATSTLRGTDAATQGFRLQQATADLDDLLREGRSASEALNVIERTHPKVDLGQVAAAHAQRQTASLPGFGPASVTTGGRSVAATARVREPDIAPRRTEYAPSPDDYDNVANVTRAEAQEIVERGPGQGPTALRRTWAQEALERMDQRAQREVPESPGQKRLLERLGDPGRFGDLNLRSPGSPYDYDEATGMNRMEAERALRPRVADPNNLEEEFRLNRAARQALRNLGDDRPWNLVTNDVETTAATRTTRSLARQPFEPDDTDLPAGVDVKRPSDTGRSQYLGADELDPDDYDSYRGFVPHGEVFDRNEQTSYIDRWQNGNLSIKGEMVPIHKRAGWEFAVAENGGFGRGAFLFARENLPGGGNTDWEFAGTYSDAGPGHTYLGLVNEYKGKGLGPKFLVAAQRLIERATEGTTYSEQGFTNRLKAHRLDVEARARERLTGIDEFETARARAFGEIPPGATSPAGPPLRPAVMREYPDLFDEADWSPVFDYYAKVEAAGGGEFSWRSALMPEGIPGEIEWSRGLGLPTPWRQKLARAGYRFLASETGSLDLTAGGRFFQDPRTRLAIAPGGRVRTGFEARRANLTLENPPEGAKSIPTDEWALAHISPDEGYSTSALLTTDGRWYRSDGEHHSDWLFSLGLDGRIGAAGIQEEQAKFGFIRLYRYSTGYNFDIVGKPEQAQVDALHRLVSALPPEASVRYDIFTTDRTTGRVVTARDREGGYMSGSDPAKMWRQLEYTPPAMRLRQAVLRPGDDATKIEATTPVFRAWADEGGLKFDRDPNVGYGFTRNWDPESDIDVVVRGDPVEAERYGARLAREWDQEVFIAVHYGQGDTPVATVPVRLAARDTQTVSDILKAAGFDGHIDVRNGEVFIVAPDGLGAADFEFRLERAAATLRSTIAADIGSPSLERAKVVPYARDAEIAEKYGIERTFDDAIGGGDVRARAGGGVDTATDARGAGDRRPEAGRDGPQGAARAESPDAPGDPLREQALRLEEARLRTILARERAFPEHSSRPYDVNENVALAKAPPDVRQALHDDDVRALERFLGPLMPSERDIIARRWGLGEEAASRWTARSGSPRVRRSRMIREVETIEARIMRDLEPEELAYIARRYGVSIPRRYMGLGRFASGEGGSLVPPPTAPPASLWDDLSPEEQLTAQRAGAVRLVELTRQGAPTSAWTRGTVYPGGGERQLATQMERFPEGVRPGLDEQGERLRAAIEPRIAPLSWEATEMAAQMIGKPAREVARNMLKRGVTTAEVEFISTEIARLMNRVTDVSKRVAVSPAGVSQQERLQAVMWMREADELRAGLEETASELGRGLNILRKNVSRELALDPSEAAYRSAIRRVIGTADPDKIDTLLASLLLVRDDPAAVYRLLRDSRKVSFWDKLFEYTQANILWSPATHLTNSMSGLVQTALLASKFATKPAIEAALHVATLGRYEREARFTDILPFTQGLLKGYVAAFDRIPNIVKGIEDLAPKYGGETLRPGGAISGLKGEVIRTPFKMLSIGDAFQTTPMYNATRRVLMDRAARKAGVSGNAKRQFLETLERDTDAIAKGEIGTGDGMAIHKQAVAISEEFALHGTGRIAQDLNSLRRDAPGLRYIARFINTPLNLTKLGIRHTPLGLLRIPAERLGVSPRTTKVSDAAQEAIVGSAAMVYFFSLMETGNATGLYPTTKAERDMDAAEGRPPLSIKVGDRWVSALVLGPLLFPYLLSAAVRQVHAKEGDEPTLTQWNEAAGLVGRTLLEQVPMIQQFRTVNDALNRPLEAGVNLVSNFATSLIPAMSLLRTAERLMDDYARRPESITEAWQAAIPILAEEGIPAINLPPVRAARDLFGRPVPGATGVAALGPRSMKDDPHPVIQEWRRHMNEDPEFAGLVKVMDTIGSGRRAVVLTPDQYDRYQVLVGQAREQALTRVISSKEYQAAEGAMQRKMLRQAKENAERSAKVGFGIEFAYGAKEPADVATGTRIALDASTLNYDKGWTLRDLQMRGKLTPEVIALVDAQRDDDLPVADYMRGLQLVDTWKAAAPWRAGVMDQITREVGQPADSVYVKTFLGAIDDTAKKYKALIDAAEERGVRQPWNSDPQLQRFYREQVNGWLARLYSVSGTVKDSQVSEARNAIERDALWPKFSAATRR